VPTHRPVLVIERLSRNERLDLLEYLPSDAIEERTADIPSGQLGEAALITLLIVLSPSILAGVSAWLAARGTDVDVNFTVEAPGIRGSFSLSARNAHELPKQIDEQGVAVPADESET
jgi:hypothetical protein